MVFQHFLQIQWRALDEINAGVCDGMTYDEVKKNKPEEYEYVNSLILLLHFFPWKQGMPQDID